jgi:predicted transcriptional regulator
MDILSEKLQLIEWLAKVNNTSVIKEFIALKKKKEKDWWNEISPQEQNEIREGLAQADRGEVVPHEQVMQLFKKWRIK